MIKRTPNPEWVTEFLEDIKAYKGRVVGSSFFRAIADGSLSKRQFQGALINFYPLIENFPKYMGLNLAKAPADGSSRSRKARDWLIKNMNVERLHAVWWRDFALGFGVSKRDLEVFISPPAEMDAINNYLWHVCAHGTLAEGVCASNFAIEGPTGEWTKQVEASLRRYAGVEGISVNKRTLQWVSAHASYDDRHPYEALEIVKAFAETPEEQEKVKLAAKRAMEYYALALESCYRIFG